MKTPQIAIPNATSRGIVTTLRPPCAQNLTLRKGYSTDNPRSLGQVLVLPSTTEPVTAPGSGTVLSITRKNHTSWAHSAGALDNSYSFEVKIDHGGYISTALAGIDTLSTVVGQYVTRGDIIGYGKTTEIFFQVLYRNAPVDPASYSAFFRGYDGVKVPGKAKKLRAGPDFITRAISDVVSYISGGIRYFVDRFCTKPPLLINIDFNGGGLKEGAAVVGAAGDYWNVYTPVDFDDSSYSYSYAYAYSCYAYLVPELYIYAGPDADEASETTSFGTGWIWETVGFGTGTEAASLGMAWRFGSTETIPEVDGFAFSSSWSFGTVFDSAVWSYGSDFGTISLGWHSGTTTEVVVWSYGTDYGTVAASWTSGSVFEALVFAFGSYAPAAGYAYVDGWGTRSDFSSYSSGSINMAWVSGGTDTFIFPSYETEVAGGTVAFWSGTVIQY